VAREHRTPAEVSHRFADAINAGDLESALACWSPAGVIAAPDGSEVRGHASLAERFGELIALGAKLQISVSDEIPTELGATASTQMTMTVGPNAQPTVIDLVGIVTYVRGPSGLKILIDQLSPKPPASTSM
jgi:SnoaL-like domain